MAVIKTGASAKKFIKPNYIVVTEFLGTETAGSAQGQAYILEDVVRDSTSISQDDNETSDIENETSDSPIYTTVTLGKYQFAAQVADTQTKVLQALMGFTEKNGKLYAPSGYSTKYVTVAIVFNNDAAGTTKTGFIIPRLQLNSKMTVESLNSQLAMINLAGTANDWDVVAASGSTPAVRAPFYVDPAYTLPT